MNAILNPAATSGDVPAALARTNRGALESLTIRRRTTGEQAAARATLMRRLRIALPVLALLLVAAFFLNTRKGAGDDAFLDDFADLNATTQNLRSAKPQFSGVDAKGNPYEITADSASQKPESKEIVELDQPRAVTVGGDQQSVVEAESGIFNTDNKRLLLQDGVTFEHAIGRDNYVLKTSAATVSIDDQTVESDQGVTGAGPGGATLKADRMQADNRDGGVVFEGSVSMRLYPKQIEGSADASPKTSDDPKNGELND
jgi:lipopolysaccharide export system protein LptC